MSSEFTSQNIIFTDELQRPGATLGSILASNSSGVFQLVTPPSDGRILVLDSGQPSGVIWNISPVIDLLWTVTGTRITPNNISITKFVLCNSTNVLNNQWEFNGMILSSTNSILFDGGGAAGTRPKQGAIIASDSSLLLGSGVGSDAGQMTDTCIIASNNCDILQARTNQSFIGGSIDSTLSTSLGFGTFIRVLVGCDNCRYEFGRGSMLACQGVTAITSQINICNSYISCDTLGHGNNGTFNTFLSTTTTTISINLARCLVKATNASISNNGVVVLSDNDTSGPVMPTLAANSFLTRFTGGVRFYTNANLTTYADLAPGSGTWVAVSDKNVKENIIEVNYDDILERVRELLVYQYNFIGNHKEVKCIGPMAQDWHKYVTPLETYTDIIDNPDKDRGKIEVEKDAKNKLGIEEMDSIGVCLSSIKSLDKKVQILTKINDLKRQKIKTLENKIREMLMAN